jgi:hypothetical protein
MASESNFSDWYFAFSKERNRTPTQEEVWNAALASRPEAPPASAPAAEVAQPVGYEHFAAIREGHRNAAEDAWFQAVPNIDPRRAFQAGFDAGYNTRDAALASSPSSAPAESGWAAFADREPPSTAAKDDPNVRTTDRVLVTNNMRARDRMGRMSHVWFASPIKSEDGSEWVAFDEGDRKIHGLSHWFDPFAAPQAVQAGGKGGAA